MIFIWEIQNSLKNKNDLTNKLYVVDVTKLSDDNIEKGKGNLTDKDIFVVTENTNNVYYLKGYRYKGKVYFTYQKINIYNCVI